MTFIQLKAKDELWIEMDGIEYDDYLKKVGELKLEDDDEYKAVIEKSKENMRSIIKHHHVQKEGEEKDQADKKNDWCVWLTSLIIKD